MSIYITTQIKHINIVYFANLCIIPFELAKEYVSKQWVEFCRLSMFSYFMTQKITWTCYVVFSISPENQKNDHPQTWACFQNHVTPVTFILTNVNHHEFPGVYQLWSLGQRCSEPSHLSLYWHSKGITRYRRHRIRCHVTKYIFHHVLSPYRPILSLLDTQKEIQKVGISFSKKGWMWHNVFWVRHSYLSEVECPRLDTNRYYYEEWLAHLVQESRFHQLPIAQICWAVCCISKTDPSCIIQEGVDSIHSLSKKPCW